MPRLPAPKPRKYERDDVPVSLAGLTVEQVIGVMLRAKPEDNPKRPSVAKPPARKRSPRRAK